MLRSYHKEREDSSSGTVEKHAYEEKEIMVS
jgi:hypothetical protein